MMKGRHWLTVVLLVAGVPLTAIGLTQGSLLMALAGLVLLLVFIFLVGQGSSLRTSRTRRSSRPPTRHGA